MKTTLFTIILFVLTFVITINAQTAKPKQTTSNVEVTIMHDNERQIDYIAEKKSGKFIKLLIYKEVYQFKEGMALVKTEKSVGFINEKGVEIIPPNGKYQWAESFSNGMAIIGTNNEYGEKKTAGFINKSGTLLIPMIYQEARGFSENLAPVKKNDKWGYINKTGAVIIPFKYSDAYIFSQGLAIVGTEKSEGIYTKKMYGYIDKTGKIILPFKYTYATHFHKLPLGSHTIVKDQDDKYLLIDKTGKTVFDFKYNSENEDIYPISAEWLANKNEIKLDYGRGYAKEYGIYDPVSKSFLVKPEYSDLTEVEHDGHYVVEKNYLKGIYKYKEIIPAVYDFIVDQDSLYYAVYGGTETDYGIKDGNFSFYDYNGTKLTKYEDKESYDDMSIFKEKLARVKRNGKYGFINKKGEEVIPLEYDSTGVFNSGIAVVFKGRKAGAINNKNETVIPFEYDQLGAFVDGLAFYGVKNMVGIIDKTGKKITEPIFAKMGAFSEGLVSFVKDKKVGFVNTKGEEIIAPTYDNANSFSENLAPVSMNGKVGYIDQKGNLVVPFIYDNAWDFKDGYALVSEGEKYFLIDKKGKVVKSY